MKRLTKIITAILLVCLLTAGSVIGASAACNERVIYYVGNNGNCNSDNACDQDGDCPPLSGLHDIPQSRQSRPLPLPHRRPRRKHPRHNRLRNPLQSPRKR